MSLETPFHQVAQVGPKNELVAEDLSPGRGWLRGEVSLAEMLADPIVRLVMERDGLDKEQVRSVFQAAAIRMKRHEMSRARPEC